MPQALTFDTLTPAEVAAVTGVSQDNQRNLRRAGYFASKGPRARFSLLEAAQLLVVGELSRRGIGPRFAMTFAAHAAEGILGQLLWQPALYAPETLAAAEAAAGDVDPLIRQTVALDRLQAAALGALGSAGAQRPAFLFVWPNGFTEFFYGDALPFDDYDFTIEAWQGPVVLLPLQAMAVRFAALLPRPVIRFEPVE